ncbi:hypothetical protein PM082_008820 [Marasmius tenuissimus]|nr:hypothetical protein PM082_008820 [Marasmius tenuissimus]
MDPPATQSHMDDLMSQLFSFIPALRNLQAPQQTQPTQPLVTIPGTVNNGQSLQSFLDAIQSSTVSSSTSPFGTAPVQSQPSRPSLPSQTTTAVSEVQAQPLISFNSSTSLNAPLATTGSPNSTSMPSASSGRIVPYTSVQMLNAVASSSSASSSSSSSSSSPSFQGRERVTTSTGFPSISFVQRANADCTQHARDSLPSKRKRPRGKAKRPPSLISQTGAPKIDDCLAVAAEGTLVVNLQVNIYPPQPPTSVLNRLGLPRHLVQYQRHRESFGHCLDYLELSHRFQNPPVATTVSELVLHLTNQLRSRGYSLPEPPSHTAFAIHEQLPLQLLSFTNLGQVNGPTKTPRLATGSFTSTTSLQDILANKREYAIPKLTVRSDNFFELNMIVRSSHHPLELSASLANLQLGVDERVRTHRCISKRVFALFMSDVDAVISEGVEVLDEEDMETSCDEDSDDGGDDEAVRLDCDHFD